MNGTSPPTADNGPTAATEDVGSLFHRYFAIETASTPALLDEVLALRYQVYCVERPFEDANSFPDGRERDEFDCRAVHALIRHRESGHCAAAVRLVLWDEDEPKAAFPMETQCGDALNPGARTVLTSAPRRRMAEISRFAVSREFRRRAGESASPTGIVDANTYTDAEGGRRVIPHLILGLFAAVLRLSVEHEVTHWLAVLEPTLLRLVKRYGIGFEHVGALVEYHGRRRPVVTEADKLVSGIHAVRSDVWSFVTDSGHVQPIKNTTRKTPAMLKPRKQEAMPQTLSRYATNAAPQNNR